MRLSLAFTLASLSLIPACGDDGGGTVMPDAADIGFNLPTASLKANKEIAEDSWMELGPADLTCLNTPSADVASTVEVMFNLKVTDFQSDQAVPNATVQVFHNQVAASPFATGTSDPGDANLSVMMPVGTKRFGYKMTSGNALPTFLLNQTLDSPSLAVQPDNDPVCMDDAEPPQVTPCRTVIQSVSNATAATLPALIGQTRIPGTGVVAGALRDCQKREVSGFIATISSVKGAATHLMGAEAFYFSSSVGLPVHHSQAQFATNDGLFMIIQVPTTTPTGYVQMWGFPTDADLALGMAGLQLIGELEVPILPDTVITGSYEPLRN